MEDSQSDMATSMSMSMSIRSPYRAPTTHSEAFAHEPHSVCFRHPAIPSAQGNLLMILDGNDNAQGYLHHETARLACAIIAGNRWDGYLATSPTAPATDLPPHGLLTGEEYYFIVPHPAKPVMDSSGERSPSPRLVMEPHADLSTSFAASGRGREHGTPPANGPSTRPLSLSCGANVR